MGEKGEQKIDPKVVKKTQDTLAKIIKKPPFTDKLLSKPPFRFLHDIITSVIKTTGLMKGLYSDSELNSENVKERESKMAFLQKAIDFVSLVTGRPVVAKPSKVITGHEAEKTNEFLQQMAEAISKKVNNEDYVKQVLSGDSKPPAGSSSKREGSSDKRKRDRDEEKKSRSKDDKGSSSREKSRDRSRDKSKDDDRESKRERGDKDRSREKDKERDKDKHRGDKDQDRKDKSRDRRDKDRDRERKEDGEHKDRDKDRHKDKERRKRKEEKEAEAETSEMNGEAEPAQERSAERKRGAAKEEQIRRDQRAPEQSGATEDDVPPQVANARKLARPSSARPAPPRVKKNDGGPDEHVMMGSSNVPNLIVDKKDDSDSDDDIFITKDDDLAAPPPDNDMRRLQGDADDDTEHGGLVKKMLETKKELEGGSQQSGPGRKTEIERSQVSDATKRKERELVERDIGRLRGTIQTLTRSVNPLGNILDFLHEDLDSMQKELDVWKRENKQNAVALKQEQSVTESSIEPLKAQLTEIDRAISDQLDLIAAVKSNVLRNDEKLDKMLGTITKS